MKISSQKCCQCKQEKPIEQFSKNIRSASGYHWTCKACVKTWQIANKEKISAYQKGYQKVYRAEHKEELAKYVADWQKNNPEKHRISVKKAQDKRREKKRLYDQERRLRLKLEKQQNEQ